MSGTLNEEALMSILEVGSSTWWFSTAKAFLRLIWQVLRLRRPRLLSYALTMASRGYLKGRTFTEVDDCPALDVLEKYTHHIQHQTDPSSLPHESNSDVDSELSFVDPNLPTGVRLFKLLVYLQKVVTDDTPKKISIIDETILIGQTILLVVHISSSNTLTSSCYTLDILNEMTSDDISISICALRLLSKAHHQRFIFSGSPQDLDVAISIRRKCIDANDRDNPVDESYLCMYLINKFTSTRTLETAKDAVVHGILGIRGAYQHDILHLRNLTDAVRACYSIHEKEELKRSGILGLGTFAALDVDVFENYHRIRRLQMDMYPLEADPQTLPFSSPNMPPGNGVYRLFFHLFTACDKQAQRDLTMIEEAICVGQVLLLMTQATLGDAEVFKLLTFLSSRHPAFYCGVLSIYDDAFGSALTALCLLPILYQWRFEHTQDLKDLDIAIAFNRRYIQVQPNKEYAVPVETYLSMYLFVKFVETRDFETLNEAITHGRAGLQGEAETDPFAIHTLAMALAGRSSLCNTDDDLEHCILLLRSALAIAQAKSLHNLMLQLRGDLVGALSTMITGTNRPIAFMDECIGLLQQLVADTPENHVKYSMHKFDLATMLAKKCQLVDDRTGLDEAISTMDRLWTNRHTDPHSPYLNHIALAHCLHFRYLQSGATEDLFRSLKIAHSVLEELPPTDVPLIGTTRAFLATAHLHRYDQVGMSSDLHSSIEYSNDRNETMLPHDELRFSMTMLSGHANYRAHRFETAMQAYREGLGLLPRCLMLGRIHRMQLFAENRWSVLETNVVTSCLELGHYCEALELSEQSKSIGWRRGLQTRDSVEQLAADHPDFEKRLRQLRTSLEEVENAELLAGGYHSAADQTGRNEELWEQPYSLWRQWESLLAEIRELPGYEEFLATPRYEQLKHVSERGPVVVIHVSPFRSDAFILAQSTLDRPYIVRLPDELYEMVIRRSDELLEDIVKVNSGQMGELDFNKLTLRPIIRELWSEIVQPIRQSLNYLAPYTRRLWWCPTGRLTFLPLHLATNGFSNDDAISHLPLVPSYTTTLSSLLRAQYSSTLQCSKNIRMLAVSCKRPLGSDFGKIPGTSKEIQALRSIFTGHELNIRHGSAANVQQVLAEMPKHNWLHLACHGIQSYDEPYRSHFMLTDGPLRMADIVSNRFENPEFAFLSACHTATGILHLSNEAMHLAAGLHFVGFRGTIATMWSVHDQTAMKVAKEIYAFLFRDSNVPPDVEEAAEALWRAIQTLRAQRVPISRLAPFIHIGV